MKDEEFRVYCVQKGIETITKDLQEVFSFLWKEKFPGIPFTPQELYKRISSRFPKRKPKEYDHVHNIQEWDIIWLAYVMVDANVLELKDLPFTAAISDIRKHRNEISHQVNFACDKKEFEIYFGSLEMLAHILDSDYKKSSPNKNIAREIKKFQQLKMKSWDSKKIKEEYRQMELEIKLYKIKEQYTEEKNKLECQKNDLHEKLEKQTAEKSEIQKKLQINYREKETLTQKLKDESKERVSLQKKMDFNHRKIQYLRRKLHQKRTEIFTENIKKRAVIRKLETIHDENKRLSQQQTMLIQKYTCLFKLTDEKTKENSELHVQLQLMTEEVTALQTERWQHQWEIKEKEKLTDEKTKENSELHVQLQLMTEEVTALQTERWQHQWEIKEKEKQLLQKMYSFFMLFAILLFLALMLFVDESYITHLTTEKTIDQNRLKEQTKTIQEKNKKFKDQISIMQQSEAKLSETMAGKSEQNKMNNKLRNEINAQAKDKEDQSKKNNKIIEEMSLQIENQTETILIQTVTIHDQDKKLKECGTIIHKFERELSETKEEKNLKEIENKELKNKLNEQTRKIEDKKEEIYQIKREHYDTDTQNLDYSSVGGYENILFNKNENKLKIESLTDLSVDFIGCTVAEINMKRSVVARVSIGKGTTLSTLKV